MWITSAQACAGLSLVLLAPGCMPIGMTVRTENHTQAVTVRTDPPGATVYRRDEQGLTELGISPVTVELPFRTVQERVDRDACAANGAGRGLLAGLDAGFEDPDAGPEALLLGALGLIIGAASGAADCASLDGPAQVEAYQVELVATKPGYYPERQLINVPRASSQLTLFMLPRESPRPAALIPPDKERFEPPPSRELRPDFVPPPLDRSVEERLNARPRADPAAALTLEVVVEDPDQALPVDTADRLTEAMRGALDGAFGDPAQLGLDVRMLQSGDLCLLSATLFSAADHQPLRVATARAGCDKGSLEAAVGRLAAELKPRSSQSVGQARARGDAP